MKFGTSGGEKGNKNIVKGRKNVSDLIFVNFRRQNITII